MKKIALGLLFCAVTLLVLIFPVNKARAQKDRKIHLTPGTQADELFVPGRVLVKFRSNVGLDHARQIVAALGVREDGVLPATGVLVLNRSEERRVGKGVDL